MASRKELVGILTDRQMTFSKDRVKDYFAELYVAGRFADAGWNVYFPHRDQGFDFIVSKRLACGTELLRPVQVKGKYPTADKKDKLVYGYVGKLTALHQEMVLAIPFFSLSSPDTPSCVAYLPIALAKKHSRGFRCEPATYRKGLPLPRRDWAKFFDRDGLDLVGREDWYRVSVGQ